MKLLTIEEKAKAYDEAIERAKKLYDNGITEEIFPELKEDDTERIRKDLIQWFDEFPDIIWRGHYKKDIIAWLEKQGETSPILSNSLNTGKNEQKSADKIEPRFKVGDWIITPENKVLQITSIEGTSYRFNNESHYWEFCYCDEQCHLWTIEDAKDGDVLALSWLEDKNLCEKNYNFQKIS